MKTTLISALITLFSVFLTGIKINTRQIGDMVTHSVGFPLTWIEFYYPEYVDLNFTYILSCFATNSFYEIDFGVFIINIFVIRWVIEKKSNPTGWFQIGKKKGILP